MDISYNHTQYTDPLLHPWRLRLSLEIPICISSRASQTGKLRKKSGFLCVLVKPLGVRPGESKPQRLENFYISQETTSTIDCGVLKVSNDYNGEQLSLGLVMPQELKTLILLFDVLRNLNSHFLRVSWRWPGSCRKGN